MKLNLFKTPRIFYWIFPRRTWGFSLKINTVYLTFDDGPQPEITEWVLDLLKENDINATFFCVGNNLIKYPKIVERISNEGHIIGNHTMNHEKGINLPYSDYIKSIEQTAELTKNNLFRPPYGRISAIDSFRLSKKYKIIMWSWLSYDFDKSVPVEKIISKANLQIKPGDIIVLHDNIKSFDRLKEILPALIKIIQSKGLNFGVLK